MTGVFNSYAESAINFLKLHSINVKSQLVARFIVKLFLFFLEQNGQTCYLFRLYFLVKLLILDKLPRRSMCNRAFAPTSQFGQLPRCTAILRYSDVNNSMHCMVNVQSYDIILLIYNV